jgi:uncharacterized protein (DUF488 family)
METPARPCYTVGHSSRSGEEFIELLRVHAIDAVVDVRSYPGSRRHPQFSKEELERSLSGAGILYRHEPSLGGRRKGRPDSRHTGWRTPGFRAYADHMETAEFAAGLEHLMELAASRITAIMCAEAVPWRCHRQLISDALVAGGRTVRHILDRDRWQEHELSPHAVVEPDGGLVYPGEPEQQKLF